MLYFQRMASSTKHLLSVREYLALDRSSPARNEYFEGEIFGVTGASRRHNLITVDLTIELGQQLADRDCELYAGEMRVKVGDTGLYTYPDIVVVCGNPVFEDAELDTLVNPTLIIEVLSKSTEVYDRGAKFEFYRALDTLKQVLLIAQHKVHIESYLRQTDQTWLFSETNDLSGSVSLPAISSSFKVANVYRKVRFD
ncbi:MAG TPA: Uma2 family endonuclease [Blastocatellia bacterium]|nr:Uma2 family endonuclease [Blastocatellia bacterium]